MPIFKIIFHQICNVVYQGSVTVEAANESEAEQLADETEWGFDGTPDIDWQEAPIYSEVDHETIDKIEEIKC